MTIVRIVDVDAKTEVSRAELADDGTISYTGADVAQGLVEQTARTREISPAAAVEVLARDGWSNGYLMVDLV